MRIVDSSFFRRVFSGGSVAFGEAYVDGLWETSDLTAVLRLLAHNQGQSSRLHRGFSLISQGWNWLTHRLRRNTLKQSRQNIQAHYDLSNEFYSQFLDTTMTYSSALFEMPGQSLESAQLNKINRMLDLAEVRAGDHVLEIGSGWGALAIAAARRGCRVTTITLSEEQYTLARQRFAEEGLTAQIDIRLQDYRELEGKFDAILSCEMIEAVGKEYLPSYFNTIRNSLKPGAKAVIQAITIPDDRYASYCSSCDWIQKHIFPGGHLPSPEAIRAHVAASGQLSMLSMQSFGHDYAETLRRWGHDFNRNWSVVETLGFDQAFRRKWNYYLSYCEAGFDEDLIDVQHLVLVSC
ncbi:class I SAM-dependent methyltransferase [Coraliomargarita sp. W4R53]